MHNYFSFTNETTIQGNVSITGEKLGKNGPSQNNKEKGCSS